MAKAVLISLRKMMPSHAVKLVVMCLWFFHCNALKQGKFKVFLEDVYHCPDPNPPYMENRTIVTEYTITSVNGKRYMSGNSTVSEPTPFRNFSGRTFSVDSSTTGRTGRRTVKMQIAGVTCRNFFAKSILMFSNVSLSKRTCMLLKGVYHYELDLDRIMHALPSWHAPGTVIHQLQMAQDGATIYCEEISVKISFVK